MVYVVGCNHGIQQEKIGDTRENTEERTEQRAHFAQLIEEIVSKEKIDLICEEWDHNGGTTIARRIAGKCGVRWFNINTGAEDLRQVGIPPIYTKLTTLRPGRKAQWHAEREKFMLQNIQEKRGGAENLFVICGFDHMLPLSELLRDGIADVEVVDYRKLDWYRPGVFFGDCSYQGDLDTECNWPGFLQVELTIPDKSVNAVNTFVDSGSRDTVFCVAGSWCRIVAAETLSRWDRVRGEVRLNASANTCRR